MKQVVRILVIALVFGLSAPIQMAAQDLDRSWEVWKLSLNFKNGKDELYKRNLTKAEAEKQEIWPIAENLQHRCRQ